MGDWEELSWYQLEIEEKTRAYEKLWSQCTSVRIELDRLHREQSIIFRRWIDAAKERVNKSVSK